MSRKNVYVYEPTTSTRDEAEKRWSERGNKRRLAKGQKVVGGRGGRVLGVAMTGFKSLTR